MTSFSGLTTDEIQSEFTDHGFDTFAKNAVFNYMLAKPEMFSAYMANPRGIESLAETILLDDTIEFDEQGNILATDEQMEQFLRGVNQDEDEEEDVDVEWLFPKKPSSSGKKIGGNYKGVAQIEELRGSTKVKDIEYYIPDSDNCLLKCYNEAYGIDLIKFAEKEMPRALSSTVGITSGMFYKLLGLYNRKNQTDYPRIQCYRLWIDEINEVKVSKIGDKSGKIGEEFCIGLLHIDSGCYHAVLYKTKSLAMRFSRLEPEDLMIKVYVTKEIDCKNKKIAASDAKEKSRYIFVYDVETCIIPYIRKTEKSETELKELVPVSLAWGLVDLEADKFTMVEKGVHFIESFENLPDYARKENPVEFNVKCLFESMLSDITECCEKYGIDKPQLFAHNGSRFDHLFFQKYKVGYFKSCIKVGTQVKSATITYGEIEIKLKDSILFTLFGLNKTVETLGCDYKKQPFDIVDKDHDYFVKNSKLDKWRKKTDRILYDVVDLQPDTGIEDNDHIGYLLYDIYSLGEVLFRFEKLINGLGVSVTTFIGLPGVAWHIMRRNLRGLDHVYKGDSPSLNAFFRESVYGGRVLHWKVKCDKPCYSIDYNSLYPSAMYMAAFPIGKCSLMTAEDLQLDINDLFTKYPHFIGEYDIKIPNIKNTIHPYKKWVKGGSTLIYPTNQTITGVYNEVDIREMMKDGYEILRTHRGVFWTKSSRIFTDLIETIYTERKKCKGPLEYVYKILLNAMYGKFLEIVTDQIKYGGLHENDIKLKPGAKIKSETHLPNGQVEFVVKNLYPKVTKPTQIGGYILSYSRALMNEVIDCIGRDNVMYSDTDSVYITKEAFESNKEFQSYMGSKLCQYKNDYGHGVVIEKAVFLDLKRYYLYKSKEVGDETEYSMSLKFNGLSFHNLKSVSSVFETQKGKNNIAHKMEDASQKDFHKLFSNLAERYFDNKDQDIGHAIQVIVKGLKKRKVNETVMITSDESKTLFTINPSKRSTFIPDPEFGWSAVSLGYDLKKPEHKIQPKVIGEVAKMCSKARVYRCDVNKCHKTNQTVVKARWCPMVTHHSKDDSFLMTGRNVVSPFSYSFKNEAILYNSGINNSINKPNLLPASINKFGEHELQYGYDLTGSADIPIMALFVGNNDIEIAKDQLGLHISDLKANPVLINEYTEHLKNGGKPVTVRLEIVDGKFLVSTVKSRKQRLSRNQPARNWSKIQ